MCLDCVLQTNNNVGCVTKNLCCSTPFHFLTGGGRQPKKQPAVVVSQSSCRLSHRLIPVRLKHTVLVAKYIYTVGSQLLFNQATQAYVHIAV